MIDFRQVSYAYPGAKTLALEGLDFTLDAGRMVAVLGANGSGKSTLARLVNGLLLPTSGGVMVDGMSTADDSSSLSIRERVGMVFQHPDDQIVATSVEDDVAFGPENLGLAREEIRTRVAEAIRDVGLVGLERREPHLLSGGQKQRLAIAGALAMRPRYLVLDEPTSMIDARGRDEVNAVLARVRAAGQGILLVTHDVAEAAKADEVLVVAQGKRVFMGRPADLVERTTDLAGWGLELPPAARLASELRARGVAVPVAAMDATSLAEALCL